MKRLVFTISIATCLILTGKINAQNAATPNPSFENWTQVGNHFDPDNWNTLNPNTSIIGVLTCTRATGVDVHTGTYAIKLTTKSVFGITANGIASTANLITTPPYGVTGGIPYTQRPDSIVGWYKCNPLNGDYGFIEFSLLDGANDTIGYVRYNTPSSAVTSYTRFSAPINYYNTSTPVMSQWILSASAPVNPVVNSNIIIDDLDLIFSGVGIAENNNDDFTIAYDMQIALLSISSKANENCTMQIFDAAGKQCYAEAFTGSIKTSLDFLSKGIYLIRVSDATKNFSSVKKISR